MRKLIKIVFALMSVLAALIAMHGCHGQVRENTSGGMHGTQHTEINAETHDSEQVSTSDANKLEAVRDDKGGKKRVLSSADVAHMSSVTVEGLVSGAVGSLPYRKAIAEPSFNDVLYLMRAGRYEAAVQRAQLIEDKDNDVWRFIEAKATILARKCSADNPRADVLLGLVKRNRSDDLKPLYDFWMAMADISEKNFSRALDEVSSYIKSFPKEKSEARKLILACADAMIPSHVHGDGQKRLSSLLRMVEDTGNTFEASSAIHFRYEMAMAAGDQKDAEGLRRKLVLHYPATQMAIWPDLARDITSYSADDRWQRAKRLIKHFDYDDARTELVDLVKNNRLAGKALEDAEWELARIAMTNTDEPGLSESIYRKRAKKSGPLQEEAVFGIARSLSRQMDYRGAIKALEQYDRRYPRGKYKQRSLYLRGWYWFDLRENEKARPLLKEYAEMTDDTAVWGFYAQTFIRESQWQEAIDAFEKLKGNTNPIVRGKALYWQAYAEHQLGREEKAHARLGEIHDEFPFTYYDILAFQREQDWYGKSFDDALTKRLTRDKDTCREVCDVLLPWGRGCDMSHIGKGKLWQRIYALVLHDEPDRARQIYQEKKAAVLGLASPEKKQSFERYVGHLTESYNADWKIYSGGIRALSSDYPDRCSPKFQMGYPQAFAPLVQHVSHQYGVPEQFMYGIMLQESRFRPWQISSADAIGALQMIPKTASKIAQEHGWHYHPETFTDPKEGFKYSAYYMHMHLLLWHGNLTFTAGSYNGGPHRIGPWMMRDAGKTMDFIVEEFSFDESRHYARKVAEHTLRYIYLYVRPLARQKTLIRMLFPEQVEAVEPPEGWGY